MENKPLSQLLEEERIKGDLDGAYASTIKMYQDQLILGAFHKNEITNTGYKDVCIDAFFNRTYEGRYWAKEKSPLTVVDAHLNRHKLPAGLTEHLSDYLTTLEVTAATEWFSKHQELVPKIQASLDDWANNLPPEAFPGIAVLALNHDLESGKELLVSQVSPYLGNLDNAKLLYAKFIAGLDRKDAAELNESVHKASLNYCMRFLEAGTNDSNDANKDELLSEAAYKKFWGDSPDATEDFKKLSWASVFSPSAGSDSENKTDPRKPASVEQSIADFKASVIENAAPQIIDWTNNIPLLGDATLNTGFFNAIQDSDGSVRRTRLIQRYGLHYAPSLAFKTFLTDKTLVGQASVDAEDVGSKEAKGKVIRSLEAIDSSGESLKIPVDHQGHMMINYSGPAHMFAHISAADILSNTDKMKIQQRVFDPSIQRWVDNEQEVDKRTYLKDKILVLGATAIGVYDLRVTPFDGNFPGVETHANVISNLLVEQARAKGEKVDPKAPGFLRDHPQEDRLMWIALIVIGVVLSALLSHFGSVAGLGITSVFLVAIYAVDKYYFFKNGYVITVLFPVSLVSMDYVTLTFYKYFTEERNKRALKGTFQKYVSPAIVNEILANPENIELGGKKMDLTVMFSDIRGFTTFSEKLDPRALSDFLNSYLTPMTKLVFDNKGTLDKYMGDAIMAFWGAPIHFKDHAKHAARCALNMLEKLKELQEMYKKQNLPPIDIGIGLNTGDMSVGNMGSDTVRSYTVMGDAVNLGSRLEGINKKYGTRIIVSEFTYEAIKDEFICREVDWVRVKGKVKPVKIFELIAEKQAPEPIASMLPHYNEGYRLYHEMKFAEAIEHFKKGKEAHPEDELSEKYVELCEGYMQEPPPADWDGVSNMKEK